MKQRGRCSRAFDVLLAGYYGFGNLGDELLALSAVQHLEKAGVSRRRIAILSANPIETERTLAGVAAFDRWRVSRVLSALGSSCSLLLGGGGLFQDASSARSCFYYWGVIRLALLRRCRVWALGQSVGPLSAAVSRRLARNALSRCDYLAVRDDASLTMARNLGIEAERMPDLVMGLAIPTVETGDGSILINVRPVGEASAGSRVAVLRAARACAAAHLPITGVALAQEDAEEIRRLQDAGEFPSCEIKAVRTADDFTALARAARGAIGMRLHFGVLALLSGLPLAVSSYDPKVREFAREWKVSDLACFKTEDDWENFDIIKLLMRNPGKDTEKIGEARSSLSVGFAMGLRRVLEDEEYE